MLTHTLTYVKRISARAITSILAHPGITTFLLPFFHVGEWASGTSPPASRRTVREPLSSYGSHYSATDPKPIAQCTNSLGLRLRIPMRNCLALRVWPFSFLYFLCTHSTRQRSTFLNTE